jgi:hypothetical protein
VRYAIYRFIGPQHVYLVRQMNEWLNGSGVKLAELVYPIQNFVQVAQHLLLFIGRKLQAG